MSFSLEGESRDKNTQQQTKEMKAFRKYVVIVFVVLAAVLGIARISASGRHFTPVSFICYGFLIGYLAAWFHIGCRQGFRNLSRFLDDSGV